MGEVYARINGVDLYRELLNGIEWSALVDGTADFIPVAVTPEWEAQYFGKRLVAISMATSKILRGPKQEG